MEAIFHFTAIFSCRILGIARHVTLLCVVGVVIAALCTATFSDSGVTCSPRDPRFADSNPAEVEQKSSGRDFKLGVPV